MKKRFTKKQIDQFTADWKQHNKNWRNKDATLVFKTLEEFIDYKHGRVRAHNRARSDYNPHYNYSNPAVHSLTDLGELPQGNTAKKEQLKYSGNYVRGIVLAHKSNYMAIGQDDDPESYAKMRRN